jgi:hypothetical protein
MGLHPKSWNWFGGADCAPPESQHPDLEDLLFRLELSECEVERAALQEELDDLVAHDAEAARTYEMHQLLERELHALFANGGRLAKVKPPSPMRRLFLRVRSFFCPEAVG